MTISQYAKGEGAWVFYNITELAAALALNCLPSNFLLFEKETKNTICFSYSQILFVKLS